MKIVLTGPKCSGKSEIGVLLAKKLNLPFYESDIETEILFFKDRSEKLNCRKICEKYGESIFRAFEKRAIKNLSNKENSVISTGGSSLLDPESLKLLSENAITILLDTDINSLVSRWEAKGIKSYLNSSNPKEAFVNRAELVKEALTQHVDIVIDNSNLSIQKTLDVILERLRLCTEYP